MRTCTGSFLRNAGETPGKTPAFNPTGAVAAGGVAALSVEATALLSAESSVSELAVADCELVAAAGAADALESEAAEAADGAKLMLGASGAEGTDRFASKPKLPHNRRASRVSNLIRRPDAACSTVRWLSR